MVLNRVPIMVENKVKISRSSSLYVPKALATNPLMAST